MIVEQNKHSAPKRNLECVIARALPHIPTSLGGVRDTNLARLVTLEGDWGLR